VHARGQVCHFDVTPERYERMTFERHHSRSLPRDSTHASPRYGAATATASATTRSAPHRLPATYPCPGIAYLISIA
jgi:hypothetical protein